MGKLIIISAPSGTGKSTLIGRLLERRPDLGLRFSVSATSRPPRGKEQHSVEYYFFSPEEFRQRIASGEFLEYEEVYQDKYYGTLRSEVEERLERGENVLFDVDYVGALNIKKVYRDRALSIFIQPPSIEALRERLCLRGTDTQEFIQERINKAEQEMKHADQFDITLINDDLDLCYQALEEEIDRFLS